MTEDLENNIAARYQQASTEQPSGQLDASVLEAARKAVQPKAYAAFGNQWLAGGSMAAVVVLTAILVLVIPEQTDQLLLEPDTTESMMNGAPAMMREEAGQRLDRAADAVAPMESAAHAMPAADAVAPAIKQGFNNDAPSQPAAPAKSAVDTAVPPAIQQNFKNVAPSKRGPSPESKSEEVLIRHPLPVNPRMVEPVETAPRLESYDMQPQRQMIESEMRERSAFGGKAVNGVIAPLYLQAGVFSECDEAIKQQADIRELGYVVTIQPVTVNGTTRYRVRIGSFTDTDARARAQQQLHEQGIDTEIMIRAE